MLHYPFIHGYRIPWIIQTQLNKWQHVTQKHVKSKWISLITIAQAGQYLQLIFLAPSHFSVCFAHVLSFHVETKPSIYLLRTQPKKQASTTTMQRWAAWLMDGHYKAIHIRTRFKKHTFRSCTTIRDKSKISFSSTRTFTNAEIYGSRAHF